MFYYKTAALQEITPNKMLHTRFMEFIDFFGKKRNKKKLHIPSENNELEKKK